MQIMTTGKTMAPTGVAARGFEWGGQKFDKI